MASGATGNALTLCILVMFISFAFGVPKCKFIAAKTKTVKIFKDLKNWNEARAHCQSTKVFGDAGDLATDTDATTHAFLVSQVDHLWIGGSDAETEKTWKWVTGEAVDMRHSSEGGHWNAGEPNDASGQDCLLMNYYAGKYDDQNCGTEKKFACEYHHKGAAVVSNKLLKYFSTPKTFFGAKKHCESKGGLLVVANNEDVNTWVKLQGNGTRKWIGATDQKTEGTWLWSDGSAVSTESALNWKEGGPDDVERVEHCAVVLSAGQWDDKYCREEHPFVCQYDKPC